MTKSMLFMFMHSKIPAKYPRSKQKKKPGNLYKSRLSGNGGISRARTYDLHDVNVAL